MLTNNGKGFRSKKGQMPLALIAVILLISGSFYCIATAEIEKSKDQNENTEAEIGALDDEIDRAPFLIEKQLGNIISDLSVADAGGTLVDRTVAFKEQLSSLLDRFYPYKNRGVTTELVSSDIRLRLENMKVAEGDPLLGESKMSFLKATGKLALKFTTERCTTEKMFDISADATSGLPLTVDGATRFELMIEGTQSALTQLMEYQLTSLAQSRIISGYGMTSIGGEKGTMEIITSMDVAIAYRNAVNILQAICFRDTGDDDSILTRAFIDAGDLISVEGDSIALNIGALLSQSLLSKLDSYVFRWLDYLGLGQCIDYLSILFGVDMSFVLSQMAVYLFQIGRFTMDMVNNTLMLLKEAGRLTDQIVGATIATLSLITEIATNQLDSFARGVCDYLGIDQQRYEKICEITNDAIHNVCDFFKGVCDVFINLDGVKAIFNFFGDSQSNENETKFELVNPMEFVIKSYIERTMRDNGYWPESYSYFMNGQCFEVYIPEYRATYVLDSEKKERVVEAHTFYYPYPTVDILEWNGWDNFIFDIVSRGDIFEDSIRALISQIASRIAKECYVTIPVDAFDGKSFSDTLAQNVATSIGRIDTLIRTLTSDSVSRFVASPFMCSAYDYIREHADEIFKTNSIRSDIRFYLSTELTVSKWKPVDKKAVMDSVDYDKYTNDYKRLVSERLDYLSIITMVGGSEGGLFTDLLARCCGSLVSTLDIDERIKSTMKRLCEEMADHIGMNPYAEIIELPGRDSFTLRDAAGKIYEETLTVTDVSDITIDVIPPTRNASKNAHYTHINGGKAASYSSVFTISFKSTLSYSVTGTSPVYASLGMDDSAYLGHVTVDTVIDVPCLSGWALAGVTYMPTDTVFSDIQGLLEDFLEPLLKPMKKMFETMQVLANICSRAILEYAMYLSEMLTEMYEKLLEPLEMIQNIAYDGLSEVFNNIFLTNMLLMLNKQFVTINLYGMIMTIETNIRTLSKTSKEIVTVTVEKQVGVDVSVKGSVAIRYSEKNGYYPVTSGGATGDDWSVNVTMDPLMKTSDYFVNVNGYVRDVSFEGTIPELVQYCEIEVGIADIPAIGTALSNIPLPIAGYKGSIDFGIDLKYDLPIKNGLMINEVELNPEGDDRGKEWVELFNNTPQDIDLEGYLLEPGSGSKKAITITDTVIPARGKVVITFDKQSLNNSKSKGLPGERLMLLDPNGDKVDVTPWMTDSDNSSFTWQRTIDGSTNWSFISGTPGTTNGGSIPGGYLLKTMILDYAKEAAIEALDEMGGKVDTMENLQVFIDKVISKVINKFVDSIAESIVEACIFLELKMTDYAETQHYGARIMLGFDSELVRDGLKYLMSLSPLLAKYVTAPEGMTGEDILYSDIYLRTVVFTAISAPGFLNTVTEEKVSAGVSVKVNLSAISNMLGEKHGRWSAEIGIVLDDVPTKLIPKYLEPRSNMNSDLWLFKLRLTENS